MLTQRTGVVPHLGQFGRSQGDGGSLEFNDKAVLTVVWTHKGSLEQQVDATAFAVGKANRLALADQLGFEGDVVADGSAQHIGEPGLAGAQAPRFTEEPHVVTDERMQLVHFTHLGSNVGAVDDIAEGR
jgi:hypothetical protein